MKNYDSYSLEDFVLDEDFRNWVQGDSKKETLWLALSQTHPEKATIMRQAEQLIRAAHVNQEPISEKEIREEVDKFIVTASTPNHPTVFTPFPLPEKTIFSAKIWLSAASILLLLLAGAGWFFMQEKDAKVAINQEHNNLAETRNETSKPLRLVLSDSSVVVLSPHSMLKYPTHFSRKERTVYLSGEGTFSVTHQGGQPFMVVSGVMITKVLGTRFVVRAYDNDQQMSVQVQSGKVSVFSNHSPTTGQTKGLILTANQAAVFEKQHNQLSKTLIENPVPIHRPTLQAEQVYNDVPLPTLLHELEKMYGIPIQFDEQSLQACRITASFSNETFTEKLNSLCKTIAATYEIVDGQVVLNGNGCH